MSLCGTISVLRCHFRGNKMTRVPRWLQNLFLIKQKEVTSKQTVDNDSGKNLIKEKVRIQLKFLDNFLKGLRRSSEWHLYTV